MADESWPIERFGIARIGKHVDPRQICGPGGLFKNLMYETITMNCRVSNAKAKKQLEWKLKYPTYREGLPATIQELEKVI